MKNIFNNLKYLGFSAAMSASLFACDTNFEEINTDPNKPTEVPSSFLLTSAQKQLTDEMWDDWNNGRFGLLYSQYWSQTAYSDESRYQIRPNVNNSFWLSLFAGGSSAATNGGGLRDIDEIIRLNKEKLETTEDAAFKKKLNNEIAVARIMKAWVFHTMTDVWGDIPYSGDYNGDNTALKNEALNDDISRPAYDSQKAIYMDLLTELKEAAAQLDESAGGFGAGDLIYKGDLTLWKKFANSLRLRVAMRMADVDAATAQTHVAELAANPAGLIADNSESAIFAYDAVSPNNNPLNEAFKTRTDFAISSTLVNKLDSLSDPRLEVYAAPTAGAGDYVGLTYGLANPEGVDQDTYSLPGEAVLSATSPGIILNYAEVEFLLAEAGARFGIGDAQTHFEKGVRASMEEWKVDPAAADAYVAGLTFNTANYKNEIGEQKWLAMYMQGIQSWIEWRRLDFGILAMPADGILGSAGISTIPTRMVYPTSEAQLNSTNLQDAKDAQGFTDMLDEKVWWDVN